MDTKAEALDFDFEEWKDIELENLYNLASSFSRKKINRSIYSARKLDETVEKLEEELKTDPDNQDLQDKHEYFKGLTSALVTQMFRISPVECIAEIQRTALPEEEQLTREDIENSIYSFVYREICFSERNRKINELSVLGDKVHDNPDDKDAKKEYEKIEKQFEFYENEEAVADKHINPIARKIIEGIKPTLNPIKLAEKHTEYLAKLANEAKQIQAGQIDLMARYENGEVDNITSELENLKEKFYDVFYQRENLKYISSLLPKMEDYLDFDQMDKDDFDLSATGAEAFKEMNKKQRYHAKVKAHEIKKGKHPNKFQKLLLHLPSKKMDALIQQYIDKGRLPLEEVMGCSREELLVRMEARKLAKKMREDKEAENKEPNQEEQEAKKQQGQEKKEGQAQGVEDLLEEEPGSNPKSVEELPEEELLEEEDPESNPKPAEERDGADIEEDTPPKSDIDFDVEAQADEMVKLLNELSLDARIDFLMTTFNLPEENRAVLMLFESLSPEAREAFCRGEMSSDRDEIDRDTKEDQVIE